VIGDVVVVCNLFNVVPFFLSLCTIEGDGQHPIYKESVGCKFVLEGMVGEKVDGGVSRSRFTVNV
jgi:hypothetical protein